MQTSDIHLLKGHFKVKEFDDGFITVSQQQYLENRQMLGFKDSHELYEFIDELAKIIPRPKKSDRTDTYVGERWKYDL
jgi:ribosomal protein S18